MSNPTKFKTVFVSLVLAVLPFSALAVDATVDTCDFIRQALLDPTVREVLIPAGVYTANRPIVVNRSGVTIRGVGTVVINLADHSNSPLLILGNIQTPPKPIYDLRVDNLTLVGNRENQDMECWLLPCDQDERSKIRNNGITIRGVHRAYITNVKTLSFRSGGIVTEKVSSELHIDNWTSKDNYFDGFAGYETTLSTITNSDLSENLGAAISLDIQFNKNTFKNIRMYKNMDVGVFMRDSHDNNFSELTVIDAGNHAIFISQVNDEIGTAPTGNVFEDLIVRGAKGNGFHLNHAGLGNKLINPKFSNVRGQDIFQAVPGSLFVSAEKAKCIAAINKVNPEEAAEEARLARYRDRIRRSMKR